MGLEVMDHSMENRKYEASDHRCLVVTVKPDPKGLVFAKRYKAWNESHGIGENELISRRMPIIRRLVSFPIKWTRIHGLWLGFNLIVGGLGFMAWRKWVKQY
jgi:hypothetical protein